MALEIPDDLTEKQYRVAEFVQEFLRENRGMSPTFQEIADGLKLRDRISARDFVERLIAKGYVERRPGRYRTLITTTKWQFRRDRKYAIEANRMVMVAIAEQPKLFQGWSSEKFDNLLSRRALGGELTIKGVLNEARKMNEDDAATEDFRALLQVEPARTVLLETLQGLKEQHTPRKRRQRCVSKGE